MQRRDPLIQRPGERRQQTLIFRDVVRGMVQRPMELRHYLALAVHDLNSIAGRPRIAPRPAIDVRGRHAEGAVAASSAFGGMKYSTRWQLSH